MYIKRLPKAQILAFYEKRIGTLYPIHSKGLLLATLLSGASREFRRSITAHSQIFNKISSGKLSIFLLTVFIKAFENPEKFKWLNIDSDLKFTACQSLLTNFERVKDFYESIIILKQELNDFPYSIIDAKQLIQASEFYRKNSTYQGAETCCGLLQRATTYFEESKCNLAKSFPQLKYLTQLKCFKQLESHDSSSNEKSTEELQGSIKKIQDSMNLLQEIQKWAQKLTELNEPALTQPSSRHR